LKAGATLKELHKERWNSLTEQSTVDLVKKIAEDSDRSALAILLETRKLFRLKDHPPLLLPEFVLCLRERLASQDQYNRGPIEIADCAYDLTIAKYSNFPDSDNKMPTLEEYPVKAMKVDCRNYYRAFLHKMEQSRDKETITTQVQEEFNAGKILQNLVYRNFLRSKLECERNSPFSVRYIWEVEDRKFSLWYPSYLTAKEFRKWLAEHFSNVSSHDPHEQKRIQSFIDDWFGRGCHISMEDSGLDKTLQQTEAISAVEFQEGCTFVTTLAETVAEEKVQHKGHLRPALRKLDDNALHQLILRIFSDLTTGDYEASRIARDFGLSKAAMSRFAGTTWTEKSGNSERMIIPDLWQNTAKALAGNAAFMETVFTSGFTDRFTMVLDFIRHEG